MWFILVFLFVRVSSNLLLSLITLEILSFVSIFIFALSSYHFLISEYYLIVFFGVFVIEGVIGLSGLIILVFFVGSDYIRTSSLIKL